MLLYVFITSLYMPLLALPFTVFDFSRRRNAVIAAVLIGLACASIGLGFHHVAEGDVTRYVAMAESYKSLTLREALDSNLKGSPLAVLWFWTLGKLNQSAALPATAMFVDYSVLAYVVLRSSNKGDWPLWELLVAFFATVSVFPLFFAVSAIRSTTALMIGTLAAYRDIGDHKRDWLTLLLYLAPVLIHGAAALVIVCRLICLIPKLTPVGAFVLSAALLGLVVAFNQYLAPVSRLLHTDIIEKLISYTEWTTGYAERVSNSLYYVVLKRLHWCFIACLVIDYAGVSQADGKSDGAQGFNKYAMAGVGCILVLSVIIEVPSYTRFTYAFYPLIVLSIVERRFGPSCNSTSAMWQLIYVVFFAAFYAIFTFALLHFMVLPDLINGILFGVFGPLIG